MIEGHNIMSIVSSILICLAFTFNNIFKILELWDIKIDNTLNSTECWQITEFTQGGYGDPSLQMVTLAAKINS